MQGQVVFIKIKTCLLVLSVILLNNYLTVRVTSYCLFGPALTQRLDCRGSLPASILIAFCFLFLS